MPRRLLILIGLVLALPAPALAQEATIVSRDVPLAGERTLASADAPARFDLVVNTARLGVPGSVAAIRAAVEHWLAASNH